MVLRVIVEELMQNKSRQKGIESDFSDGIKIRERDN